ncbi:outer membrane protein assembly factor BamB family protein [Larkinella soli]|uniref:outer membrane protein assembly factor BamB family protein n=1 Tax=Larkinella soli TaxID=1770527 RepID=UPI000FFBE7FF|nr:PQQ-binding-like beta-propeller repeat protein [Larkinella soli]
MKNALLALLILCPIPFCFGQTVADPAAGLAREPALQWKFQTGGPVVASPVVRNQVAYVGSLDSTFYAIDLDTGRPVWTRKIGGSIRSTACLHNDLIFFVGGNAVLYALEAGSGRVRWRFQTLGGILGERKYDFADYYHSSPLLYRNLVCFGSGDGRVYAVDADTGKLVWSYPTGDIVHTSPVVQDDRLFIGSSDGNLYALNAQTGTLLWKFKSVGHRYFPKGEMQGSPVAANGLVYIGSRDYNLYAVDAQAGYGHWNKAFPLGWATALSVRDTVLYVGTSDDRLLVALDGRTGREYWRTDTKFNIFGGSAFSPTTLFVGTLMGKLLALDRKTGTIRWTFTTDGYKRNRSRYFRDDDSFRPDIQTIIRVPEDFLQLYNQVGAVFSAPTLAGNRLLFSSMDGAVYCLISRG